MRKLEHNQFEPKHVRQVYELAKEWWARISHIPVDAGDVEFYCDRRLGNIWVDDNGDVIGYYFMLEHPHPFNHYFKVATIMSVVVKEEYRGTTLFSRMWRQIKEDCEDVAEINFSDTVENPMPYLEKLGFVRTGNTYRRIQ